MKTYTINQPKKLSYSIDINTPRKNKKKHSLIGKLMVIIMITVPVFVFSAIMYRGYKLTQEAYNRIEQDYTNLALNHVSIDENINESDVGDEMLTRKIDFDKLKQEQSDIYAWITIPDTSVDYPILQSTGDKTDDYWLNHNLDGTIGYPGTIFTERMFGQEFKTFNTIIYGHNMKNQTMFGCLHNFETRDYFEAHEYVYIYTPKFIFKYQVVCAATISDAHLAIAYNGYQTEQQRQQFIDYLKANAALVRNIETGKYDSYITLSTCTNDDTKRFIILAKMVDKISNSEFD